MANKKITDLTEKLAPIEASDCILHLVDGITANIPVNKKVSVETLIANVPRTSLAAPLTNQHLLDVVDTTNGSGNNVNKSVSITDLFENVPGLLNLSQTPETVTAAGLISITDVKTLLTLPSNDTANVLFTLADGTEGRLKFIVMTVKDGAFNGVVTTNLHGDNTLTFDAVGDSVLLLFTGGKWAVISNNGVEVTTV